MLISKSFQLTSVYSIFVSDVVLVIHKRSDFFHLIKVKWFIFLTNEVFGVFNRAFFLLVTFILQSLVYVFDEYFVFLIDVFLEWNW